MVTSSTRARPNTGHLANQSGYDVRTVCQPTYARTEHYGRSEISTELATLHAGKVEFSETVTRITGGKRAPLGAVLSSYPAQTPATLEPRQHRSPRRKPASTDRP